MNLSNLKVIKTRQILIKMKLCAQVADRIYKRDGSSHFNAQIKIFCFQYSMCKSGLWEDSGKTHCGQSLFNKLFDIKFHQPCGTKNLFMRSALYEIFKAHSKKMFQVILTISLSFLKAYLIYSHHLLSIFISS